MLDTDIDYQPNLPVKDAEAAAEIRSRTDLEWFHGIRIGDHLTTGYDLVAPNWRFVSQFLQKHGEKFAGKSVLEPGCADGLWTAWMTKLGATDLVCSDIDTREQFKLVVKALGLNADYHPGIISTDLGKAVRRRFPVVTSLGLLYHVHDPLMTLTMYRRFLSPGGYLFLETATVDSEAEYMQYSGGDKIYRKAAGNQFIPSSGFLRSALNELGMDVLDFAFRSDGFQDELGNKVGRSILVAQKTRPVEIHFYTSLLNQLDMNRHEFAGEKWYHMDV